MIKKLSTVFLVLLLAFALPLNVMAGGVSVTQQGEVGKGDEIVFEVTLSEDVTAKTGAIYIEFDPDVLEVVSYRWHLTSPLLQYFDVETGCGAFAYMEPKTVGDLIFSITFRVKDSAAYGDSSITVSTEFSQSGNPSEDGRKETANSDVYVSCVEHVPGDPATCEKQAVCDVCGISYGELEKHTPGEWTVVEEPTSSSEGLEKQFCTVCGEELASREIQRLHVTGDVDGNGKVNTMDYVLVKRHVMKILQLDGERLERADVNGDGRINVADYTILKRIVLGTYKP